MRSPIEAVLPFWLDRPDLEALEIAEAVHAAGLDGLWIGEMATFDAFALATAIGARAPGLRLRIGPLPISVRTPASIALGASTVAGVTGVPVDIALGASSPFIVSGWHDRDWSHSVGRMRETIECLRPILRGERGDYDGRYVRSHGFRLRNPLRHCTIGVGAFGPSMLRLAAECADELVLNLASPQRVARIREQMDRRATATGRVPPHVTAWVPVAVRPGAAALHQLASQLAVYLAPPGYGEMFCDLGFTELVERARAGARRAELAGTIPLELASELAALGTPEQVGDRIRAYLDAGADTVAVIPVTAEDPAGRIALACAADIARTIPTPQETAL
ncbi:LLM class F420-dependent oxidoreductase [Mycobacterium paraterrae]|uniref:LLM class F420-dependent oxidoreductase n=1 Tax=Mycobacterium paraterrae TaxID=577492 RepID=A0ABY3VJ15_9MYCO|nr:LLM class F420-dependent oxidoreductase [Mycobacterium paraterrae]UMB69405.1 LLM class F420-dependent oxidoreductase [Mycobacterium paraterrae]